MNNEKIICGHCQQIISHVHYLNKFEFKSNTIVTSNKHGVITKVKTRGIRSTNPFGNLEVEIGYITETQLKCARCNKKTSIKITNTQ